MPEPVDDEDGRRVRILGPLQVLAPIRPPSVTAHRDVRDMAGPILSGHEREGCPDPAAEKAAATGGRPASRPIRPSGPLPRRPGHPIDAAFTLSQFVIVLRGV
jgi:hypothetical protein